MIVVATSRDDPPARYISGRSSIMMASQGSCLLCFLSIFNRRLEAVRATTEPPWPLREIPVTSGGAGGSRPTVHLTDFGGIADGRTDNSQAFARAFGKLRASGGGTLVVPSSSDRIESVYISLPLRIDVSHLSLVLEQGVRLKAKTDTVLSQPADWPTVPPWTNGIEGTTLQYAPFIHAVNVSDLVITGSGTIDGNGSWFYEHNWCGGHHCRPKLPHGRPRLAVIERSNKIELSYFTTNVSGEGSLPT